MTPPAEDPVEHLPGQLALVVDEDLEPNCPRRTRPPEPLTTSEVSALLAAPSRRSSAGIRDRALLAIGLRCGLRLSEMLDLEVRDVDLDELTIRVRHAKRADVRLVAMDTATRVFIIAWLDRRQTLIGDKCAPLLCTYRKGHPPGRMDESYVRRALRRYGNKAGIARPVHPHGLRHTFTTTAVREGVSLAALRLQLGHADLRTTAVYVRGLDPIIDLTALGARDWNQRATRPPALAARAESVRRELTA